MRRLPATTALLCAGLALLSCRPEVGVSPPGSTPGTPRTERAPYDPADPVGADVIPDDGHHADVLPQPTPPEPATRSRRRMDLDQLDQSIRVVTGGIGWTETRGGQEISLWQDLSRTLGKPDYVEITTEDLEPSATFVKFMDDAARSVCTRLLDREIADTDGRVFFTAAEPTDTLGSAPDKVSRNLVGLVQRFHGRRVSADSPELANWKWLMRSVELVHPGNARESWNAVCVGLMTHPDFYSY